MNKLTALRILSNAYNHIAKLPIEEKPYDAMALLERKFHTIRRSLQDIRDLRSKQDAEGMNGKMPRYF